MTLQEFTEILDTVTVDEFKSRNELTWYEANCFTWNKAILMDEKFPFFVCDEQTGKNGRERYEYLQNAFKILDENIYDDENPIIMTTLNTVDYSCFIVSVKAKDMRELPTQYGYTGILVTPISYYMKIVAGTKSVINESNKEYTTLNAMICPGVLDDSFDVSKIDDLSKSMLSYILEPNMETGESKVLADLFWGQTVTQTDQAKKWLDMASTAFDPNSTECKDFYNSIVFRFYFGSEEMSNAATILETRLYSSYVPSSQTYIDDCVHAFILAMSLRPEVCSLQVRSNMMARQEDYQYAYSVESHAKSSGYGVLSTVNTVLLIMLIGFSSLYLSSN